MKELTTETCIRQQVDIEKLQSLRKQLLQKDDLDKLADLLAMAGNATRLKMLFLLVQSAELCVCDMADIMGMGVSAISHQLRKLRDRGVIQQRREGPTIYYQMTSGIFKDLLIELFEIDD